MAKYKSNSLIPLAPLNYSGTMSRNEQYCAAWQVISKCDKTECFVTFVKPELATSPSLAARLAREFFGSSEVVDFMDRYERLLKDLGKPAPTASAPKPKTPPPPKLSNETEDEYKKRRKREAAEAVVEKIIERVDEVEDIDGLLDTIKAMKDTKFFDDEAMSQKPPMRYLPETCLTSCRYRSFVESQIVKGVMIDECKYCKAYKFATDNGLRLDATNMLDIPTNVVDMQMLRHESLLP